MGGTISSSVLTAPSTTFCWQCYQSPCACHLSGFYTTPSIAYYYQTGGEPKCCVGKAHVFECEHVTHCNCGKVERVMPKPPKPTTKGKAKK